MLVALGRSVLRMPIVLTLFATYAVILLGSQISGPFVPILVGRLYSGSDLPTAIGMVSTGAAIAMSIAVPIWGRMGDRLGHRRILTFALTILVPALAIQSWVTSLPQLLAAQTLQGAFQAAIAPLLMSLLALHSPEERRASILNLSLFPNYFARMLGPTLGASIAGFNLQALFVVGGAIVLLGLTMLFKFVPRDEVVTQA
jgi:MFS family permease